MQVPLKVFYSEEKYCKDHLITISSLFSSLALTCQSYLVPPKTSMKSFPVKWSFISVALKGGDTFLMENPSPFPSEVRLLSHLSCCDQFYGYYRNSCIYLGVDIGYFLDTVNMYHVPLHYAMSKVFCSFSVWCAIFSINKAILIVK